MGKADEKYEFVGRMGTGSFGVVEKVNSIKNGQFFACKVAKHQRQKFGRKSEEHSIHTSLSHPNIVKMHEVVDGKDNIRMVLDIADTDLKQVIESRQSCPDSFSRSMRFSLCRGTACGLHYLHEEVSLLHRDLKPSNILVMFEQEPRPLISDFGLARHRSPASGSSEDAADAMTAKVISNGYIPPELLSCRDRGAAHYDVEVDIWSFGVVAFEVATLQQFLPIRDKASQLQCLAQRMGTAGGVATGYYVPQQLRGARPLEPLWKVLAGNDLASGVLAALRLEPTQRASARELESLFSPDGGVLHRWSWLLPRHFAGRRSTSIISRLTSIT